SDVCSSDLSAMGEDDQVPFELESYRVILEHGTDGEVVSEATVRVALPDGQRHIATAEGNGPVNALDAALRAALTPVCPWLTDVELSDYKVRILTTGRSDGTGTDAVTRVLVESTGPAGSWTTVGVHSNVVEASWLALVDALAYAALRERERGPVAVSSSA